MSTTPSLPEKETILHADLWTAEPGEPDDDVSALARAMVADLLASTVTLSAEPGCASFQTPVQAIAAARHLERLVAGFSRAWPEGPLQALITLSLSGDTISNDRALALKTVTTTQILLLGDLCDTATAIPGLKLAAIPRSGSDARPALQLLPPVHMPGFVADPPETRVRAPKPTRRPELAPTAVMPVIRPANLAAATPSASRPAASVPIAATSAFEPAEAPVSPVTLPLRWVAAGIAAIVLFGLILALLPFLRKKSPPLQTGGAGSNGVSGPTSTGGATGASEITGATGATAATGIAGAKGHTGPKGSLAASGGGHPPTPPPPPPTEPKGRGMEGILNRDDLRNIVGTADRLSGNGDYDTAIKDYLIVLKYDPGNVAAKDGLAKATYNKNHP